jgi:hypothetical protein
MERGPPVSPARGARPDGPVRRGGRRLRPRRVGIEDVGAVEADVRARPFAARPVTGVGRRRSSGGTGGKRELAKLGLPVSPNDGPPAARAAMRSAAMTRVWQAPQDSVSRGRRVTNATAPSAPTTTAGRRDTQASGSRSRQRGHRRRKALTLRRATSRDRHRGSRTIVPVTHAQRACEGRVPRAVRRSLQPWRGGVRRR